MNFDFESKRTPEEIRSSLLMCAESKCEECCFYEAEAPRGYSPCHEWMKLTQAAQYIGDYMVLKNIAEDEIPEENPERTAKVEWSEVDGCHLCGDCGFAVCPNCDVYCAGCGAKLDWSE